MWKVVRWSLSAHRDSGGEGLVGVSASWCSAGERKLHVALHLVSKQLLLRPHLSNDTWSSPRCSRVPSMQAVALTPGGTCPAPRRRARRSWAMGWWLCRQLPRSLGFLGSWVHREAPEVQVSWDLAEHGRAPFCKEFLLNFKKRGFPFGKATT